MTADEITSDKQPAEPKQDLPPIPEEDTLTLCKDCRRRRTNDHFHKDGKLFKTCNTCRAMRKKQRDNRRAKGKLAPSQEPEVRKQYDKDYNKNKRKPSPSKPRARPTEEQKEKKRLYNKAYRTRKKAEKEALAKM